MIPVMVKLCESPGRAGGLLMIKYTIRTGYFWEVDNRLKVLQDKVFSKIP
jgi:hypothetical protein